MKTETRTFMRASALIVATTIGAGVFGIPYAISQGGTRLGIVYFIFLGLVALAFNLIYGEIVLRTRSRHRLPGFAGIYLGEWGRRIALATDVVGIYGILTAHLILGGFFLLVVLGPIFGRDASFWTSVYFVMVAAVTFFGLPVVSKVEYALTWVFLATIVIIALWSAPHANLENLWQAGAGRPLLPYGVIFFSLLGAPAIPLVRDALGKSARRYRMAIISGTVIAIAFTALFAFTILGVTGGATSEEALQGLRAVLGDWVVILGSGFGLLSVLTTSIAIALYLKEVYQYDLKWNRTFSWFLAVVVPFLFFVFFAPTFIHTVAVTGAVVGGGSGVLLILIHRRAQHKSQRTPEYRVPIGRWVGNALIILFIIGIILEIAKS